MKKETVKIEIDLNLKKEAETLFEKLGLDLNTAINMFLSQSVREQAMPFVSVQKFDESQVKIRTSIERLLAEADKAARNETECYSYNDVFNLENE